MALSARLQMRQGQTLAMTPQLLQAIKLLQLSTIELAEHVEAELAANPLLERAAEEGAPETGDFGGETTDFSADSADFEAAADFPDAREREAEHREGDWALDSLPSTQIEAESRLDTDLSNAFDGETVAPTATATAAPDGPTLGGEVWSGVSAGGGSFDAEELTGVEGVAEAPADLATHLATQLALATADPAERLIGAALIDAIDAGGYLTEPVDNIAARLDAPVAAVEHVLARIQTLDPSGVGARTLAECLAIQLKERDRYDPAMQALVARLDLVARREFVALQKACGVDAEDIADMVRELRALEPKPGRAFGGAPAAPVIPDVIVRPASNGGWNIELNADALPRVLVNQAYYAQVSRRAAGESEKRFVQENWQSANWLIRSLDQRAKTILKVATEIVRRQDGFLMEGVSQLRPLTLRQVGDAIGMHESTISRVTSNKFMATHRGLFEMKYFFSTALPGARGGASHSSESVRHRIRQLIDAEEPVSVLSDDAIVEILRRAGIEIARRTVAKYRDSLSIASSKERKREKMAMSA